MSSLRPYFNVKLVGERTYGKSVGFFRININKYAIYLSSFLIRKAEGLSDYFIGMEPNFPVAIPSNPNLGDPEELCFKTIISAINSNLNLATKAKEANILKAKLTQQPPLPNVEVNIGMIENRLRLKL